MEDILQEFNYEANELARKRDAVGLLELMRRNKREISEEEENAEERRQAALKNYNKTLKTMDESLQKQLKKAEEARVKEYEALNRNLARQAELKALYEQWEEEDRQRKLDKTLKEMVTYFQSLDGMTQAGLNKLLQDWGAYYNTLINLINTQNAAISAGTIVTGGTVPMTGGSQIGIPRAPVRLTGQGGQVSQLLADYLDSARIQRIPETAPNRSSETKDIRVTVDGSGLDPYIQRVVARSLMEIERNS